MSKFLIFLLIMGVLFCSLYFGGKLTADGRMDKFLDGGVNVSLFVWQKLTSWWQSGPSESMDYLVANLTDQGKVKIDEWLAKKGLNEYGDKQGTVYTGGTPAFNEQTGQNVDKYLLILQKFPELVKELDLGKYLQPTK